MFAALAFVVTLSHEEAVVGIRTIGCTWLDFFADKYAMMESSSTVLRAVIMFWGSDHVYVGQHVIPIPLSKYSVHVVPRPCSVTGLPFSINLLFAVDHFVFCGGDGGGGGGGGGGGDGDGGGGGGPPPPHHIALPPELHWPRHFDSVSHPGLVLHCPQLLHEPWQACPHMVHVPAGGTGGGEGGGPLHSFATHASHGAPGGR